MVKTIQDLIDLEKTRFSKETEALRKIQANMENVLKIPINNIES